MTGGQLHADLEQYQQAVGRNSPPPPIASDPLIAGQTPVEQLLRVLGLAANAGDSSDYSDTLEEHARRDAQTAETAEGFAGQDQQAATAMAQQLPQLAAGLAGGLTAALGGALQTLGQLPQQLAQVVAQTAQADRTTAVGLDDPSLAADPLADDLGSAATDFGDPGDITPAAGGWRASGGFGAAAPGVPLGPPAVPSAATSPASAPPAPRVAATVPGPAPAGGAGMAGVPMVPAGAVPGGTGRESHTDTKRVSVPAVRNGAPVQGRITVAPTDPVTSAKHDGRPVATRRVVLAADRTGEDR